MTLASAMGFLMYGMGYSVPLLKRDMGISRSLASAHNIGFAATITLISFAVPKLIQRYSPRLVMSAGWIITTVSLISFAVGKSLWITVPAMSLAGAGATLFNNANAATLGQASGMSMKVMLRLAGVATASGALAPSIIGTLIRLGISWRITLGLCALLIGVIAVKIVPHVPDRPPVAKKDGERHWDYSLLVMVLFGFSANFMESATGAWALDLLISRDVTVGSAVLLVALFSYGIAISRLGFSFTSRVSANRVWAFSFALAFIGLLIVILLHSPSVTVVGLLVAALGIGPIGALALMRAAQSHKGADAGIAANVIGAGPAIGFGPWVMGWASDRSGFSWAYGIPLVMLFITTALYLVTTPATEKKLKVQFKSRMT
ncbi:MAG: MFS transporter [Actinobacteria bacterium]|nr:MFS transporter [Actinomycetota bacterium]